MLWTAAIQSNLKQPFSPRPEFCNIRVGRRSHGENGSSHGTPTASAVALIDNIPDLSPHVEVCAYSIAVSYTLGIALIWHERKAQAPIWISKSYAFPHCKQTLAINIGQCSTLHCLPQRPESSNTSRSHRIIRRRICECVPACPSATSVDYQAPRLTLLADVLLSDHRVTSNRCPYTQRTSPSCLTSPRLRRNARHRHTLDIQNIGTPSSSRLRYR